MVPWSTLADAPPQQAEIARKQTQGNRGPSHMTTDRPVQSAAPDELAVRVARVGRPARGAQDRQGALSSLLQAVHRAVLGAFLGEAGAPELTAVGRLAAVRQLEPQAALVALAAADLVHTDPIAGRVRVASPFSGAPTAHRVKLADQRRRAALLRRLDVAGGAARLCRL
jgi:hypothetical protein